MSDGSEYTDYRLDYAWVSPASAEGWVCPDDKLKYFRATHEDRGETHVQVFCYDQRVVVQAGWRDEEPTYAWLGRSVPERSDFRIAVTISPGSEDAYDSGVQRVETGIGRWYGNVYVSH
ncbi:hypothetical protein [Albimonas donghaensis]|nr:hypothetical protein [Albimonas donghaensis]